MAEVKNICRRWHGHALNHGGAAIVDHLDAVQTADGKWAWVKKGTNISDSGALPLSKWHGDNVIQKVADGSCGAAHETYAVAKMSEILTRYTLRDIP